MDDVFKSQQSDAVKLMDNLRRSLFWDVDPDSIDFKKNSEYVIARILEYGNIKEIAWMFRAYDRKKIRDVFITHRGFSPRTAYFWKSFFNLRENQILCLKKSYQKMHKMLWPY